MFCLVSLKRYELITIHAHYVDHCSWMTMHKTIFFPNIGHTTCKQSSKV